MVFFNDPNPWERYLLQSSDYNNGAFWSRFPPTKSASSPDGAHLNLVSQQVENSVPLVFPSKVSAYGFKAYSRGYCFIGGIKEIAVEGLRSSGRIRAKPNMEATHLERAMMIDQHRYDRQVQSMSVPHNLSLLAIWDDDIFEKANRLGVSLGSSKTCRNVAEKVIKDNEFLQRSLTILSTKNLFW
jgi:hypothetical protein